MKWREIKELMNESVNELLKDRENLCFYMDCQEKDITSFYGHDSEGQKLTNKSSRSIVYITRRHLENNSDR